MFIAAITNFGMKLLTSAVIEKIVIIGLQELVKSTKSNIDDDILSVVVAAIHGTLP